MAFTKSFFKKCMALCLCALMLSSFGNLFFSANAAGDEDTFTPTWFDEANDGKWWDGNSGGGLNGPDGGFLINHTADYWQYFYRWGGTGSARVDGNGPGGDFDVAKYPVLNYDINSSKAIDIYIQVYKILGPDSWGDRTFIKLKSLEAGENTGSIDLTESSEFMAQVNDDSLIFVSGVSFYTNGFVYGDTVNVGSLDFTKTPKYTDGEEEKPFVPTWFDEANDGKWWDGNSGGGLDGPDGGFLINHTDDYWQYFYRWGGTGSARVDGNGPGSNFDVSKYQTLNYNLNSSKAIDIYVQVYKINGDTVDDSTRSFIKLAELSEGANAGSVKLTDNAEFMSMVNSDNMIHISGISFYTHSFEYGNTINVYSLNFTNKAPGFSAFKNWFSATNDSAWWDENCSNGLTNADGGFLINHPDDKWEYFHRWSVTGGTGRLDCNGPGVDVNFDTYNSVSYDINATKPIDLYVQAYNIDANGEKVNRTFIKLTSLTAGSNVGTFDLRANEQLMAMLNSDNNVHIAGFSFMTKGFVNGDKITVSNFDLFLNPADYVEADPLESWLVNATDSNWWSWNWNFATGESPQRLSASYEDNGDVVVTYKGFFEDLKYMGDTINVDLNKTPYLYCNMKADFPCDLYLLVSGSSEGNNGVLIESGIEGDFSKVFDIKEVLSEYVNGNSISVYGFRIFTSNSSNGKAITFKTMDFGSADADFSGDRAAKPSITLATLNPVPATTATITAPADAKKIQYKIGSAGEWTNYTGPINVTKNFQIFARYVAANNTWSLIESYKITNIKAEVSGEAEPVIPNWFTQGFEDKCWYNWDWAHNKNDEGRFFITYPDNIWTAKIGKEWCSRLETQHNDAKYHCVIDLDEQTNAFYKINSQFEVKVSLKIKVPSGKAEVYIGTIQPGKSADSIDIAGNSELLSLSDDDNKITVSGLIFEFGAKVGQTISVERFLFDAEDAYYEGYPGQITVVKEIPVDWFNLSNIDKWTSLDKIINKNNVGSSVLINDDNDWEYTVIDSALSTEATSGGNSIKTNLKMANTLFYKIRSDFDAKVQLGIKYKGQIHYIDVSEVKAGKNFSSVDLTTIEGIENYANNGSLNITGVRFIPVNAKNGDSLKVDLFAFNKKTAVYPDYIDEAAVEADKKAAAEVDKFINAIGTVTLESKAAIEKARSAFDALTVSQKFYVTRYSILVDAENAYFKLYMDSDNATSNIIDEEYIINFMKKNKDSLIEIKLEEGTELSATLLAAAKNYNCDIKISVYSKKTDNLIYSILIRSDNITDTVNTFDTKVYTSKLDISSNGMTKLEKLTGNGKTNSVIGLNKGNKITSDLTVTFGYSESLLRTDSETVYVYYYDEENGVLAPLTSANNVKDSMASFNAKQGGIYVMSADALTKTTATGGIAQTGESGAVNIFIVMQVVSGVLLMLCAVAFAMNKRKRGMSQYENL